jgi:hypothetical protein
MCTFSVYIAHPCAGTYVAGQAALCTGFWVEVVQKGWGKDFALLRMPAKQVLTRRTAF